MMVDRLHKSIHRSILLTCQAHISHLLPVLRGVGRRGVVAAAASGMKNAFEQDNAGLLGNLAPWLQLHQGSISQALLQLTKGCITNHTVSTAAC